MLADADVEGLGVAIMGLLAGNVEKSSNGVADGVTVAISFIGDDGKLGFRFVVPFEFIATKFKKLVDRFPCATRLPA